MLYIIFILFPDDSRHTTIERVSGFSEQQHSEPNPAPQLHDATGKQPDGLQLVN